MFFFELVNWMAIKQKKKYKNKIKNNESKVKKTGQNFKVETALKHFQILKWMRAVPGTH